MELSLYHTGLLEDFRSHGQSHVMLGLSSKVIQVNYDGSVSSTNILNQLAV